MEHQNEHKRPTQSHEYPTRYHLPNQSPESKDPSPNQRLQLPRLTRECWNCAKARGPNRPTDVDRPISSRRLRCTHVATRPANLSRNSSNGHALTLPKRRRRNTWYQRWKTFKNKNKHLNNTLHRNIHDWTIRVGQRQSVSFQLIKKVWDLGPIG